MLLEIEPYNKHGDEYKKCKVQNIDRENVEIIDERNKKEIVHKNRLRKAT